MADNAVVGQKEAKRFEFKRLGYTLMLEVAPDGLVCKSTYTPSPNGAPLSHEELSNYLAQAKVREGINDDAVEELLAAAISHTEVDGHPLAYGIPMVPGEDGSIALTVKDSLESAEEDAEEDAENETVDFRVVQSFCNVTTGDLVGQVLPPGEGTPGLTVSGTVIPPKPGTPLNLVLAGNVSLAPDGCSLHAEADGRVFCQGGEISVEDVYKIRGDVDFKVGNVLFNGFLDVSGDVLDGFSINASKGIKVRGNIGVCRVESLGDISFGGMNGQGKGEVSAGGNVFANYINDVAIETAGDIVVEYEMRNCSIKALGSVRVNRGGLSGGECVAMGGVEAASIGTVTSLRTLIVVGVNYRDQEEINRLFNDMKQLIASFNAGKGTMDKTDFSRARAEIANRIQEVRARQYVGCNPKVNVKKKLYDGVNITVGSICEEMKEEQNGPISIIENTIEGGFRCISLTDLSVRAQDIERAYVQQHEFMLRRAKGVAS
ncbi:hypothetical protein OR1_02060 [Geobacter sp. OR-1]|uniref:DUF342 domain-containing protein n=1 Tax=Geobacter sp. OR-1 TaxID=1266765 RepID=UPI00054229B2|nr:FapA family protein [Geobacter sp. OR-1]GAM09779.1 hypothetical protein OR1_02060 [Geobacter sp. OR-1]